MRYHVSKLEGVLLDLAVARAEGLAAGIHGDACLTDGGDVFAPSSDWSQAGPLIDREHIAVVNDMTTDGWQAWHTAQDGALIGASPLEAAMRCLVTLKLGAQVTLP